MEGEVAGDVSAEGDGVGIWTSEAYNRKMERRERKDDDGEFGIQRGKRKWWLE